MALAPDLALEVQKLAPSAIIDLFEMSIYPEITDNPIYAEPTRFHAGVNGLDQNLIWQGIEYIRFPLEFTGFETNTKGTIPRPVVRIANIGGAISSLLYQFENLIGAKITRKRTLYKYIDAVNYPDGINPEANPDIGFADEVYYVSRKVIESGIFVELELSPAWDLHGIKLPRRLCTQNVCMWQYKGIECGYSTVPSVTKVSEGYQASLATGITVTSIAHKQQVGAGIHLRFTDANASLSGVYNIHQATTNTFTVLSQYLSSNSSGVVSITNRFSSSDEPLYTPEEAVTFDRCSKRLSSCQLRYGAFAILPYGAFPGVGWIR